VDVAECGDRDDAEVSGVCGGVCRNRYGRGDFGFDGGASASDGAGVVRAGVVGAGGETLVASSPGLGLVDCGGRWGGRRSDDDKNGKKILILRDSEAFGDNGSSA
jgi:hypothetical protein